MKVYTAVNTNNCSTNVGVVLVGYHDQIYFEDGFKLTTQDKVSAHVYGLKRAISFVKNMDPLYCKKNVLEICHDNVRVDIDKEMMDRIEADEYIRRFVESRDIKVNVKNKDLTDFDKQMLLNATIKISPLSLNKGYEKERF